MFENKRITVSQAAQIRDSHMPTHKAYITGDYLGYVTLSSHYKKTAIIYISLT